MSVNVFQAKLQLGYQNITGYGAPPSAWVCLTRFEFRPSQLLDLMVELAVHPQCAVALHPSPGKSNLVVTIYIGQTAEISALLCCPNFTALGYLQEKWVKWQFPFQEDWQYRASDVLYALRTFWSPSSHFRVKGTCLSKGCLVGGRGLLRFSSFVHLSSLSSSTQLNDNFARA